MSGVGRKLHFLEDISRHKALFLLLLRGEDYITSEELADKLAVTSRTIKSDIKSISENLKKYMPELSIEAKRSRGIRIVFADEEIKKDTKEYFQIYQIDNIDTEFEKRVKYIVKRLLTSEMSVRVEQLQEELHMNTSNYIQGEMKAVRSMLEKYNLSVQLVSKYGMIIQGNKFNKLVCLVKTHAYFDDSELLETTGTYEVNPFASRFGTKEQIKKIICSCLGETRIVFSDLSLEKFAVFFILLCNSQISQRDRSQAMQKMDFSYTITDEYRLACRISERMGETFPEYEMKNPVFVEFLTYMAIMNTDLYRIRDCTEENYGSLIGLAERIRNMILSEFENVFKVKMTSETVRKDLLKILIPISMKIKLKISDDLDVGLYNHQTNKLIIAKFVDEMSLRLTRIFGYEFSVREKNMISSNLYVFINDIELEHKKMKIALLAIDGRLSTQQLKFCIKKSNYTPFVEKIETKVLYELGSQEKLDYDYYFCSAYGKNMNIPYTPISFFEEGTTEKDYERQLDLIFLNAYDYGKLLPGIRYHKMQDVYKIQLFPAEKYLRENVEYICTFIETSPGIAFYISFCSRPESVDIFYFDNDGVDIKGISKYVFINIDINNDEQKFKMILTLVSNMIDKADELGHYCQNEEKDVSVFFQK